MISVFLPCRENVTGIYKIVFQLVSLLALFHMHVKKNA